MNLAINLVALAAFAFLICSIEVFVDQFVKHNQCPKHEECRTWLRRVSHAFFGILLVILGYELARLLSTFFPLFPL